MRDAAMDIRAESAVAAKPLLEARGLSFAAGGHTLIHGINLGIEPGKRTLVMGANGSGKSLLLRLLHGLLTPSSGKVLWRGRPPDHAARRAQAMVFQRPIMLRRSVLANLNFALKIHGFAGRARAARAQEALEMARLTDLARQPARVLSGGEQQRLAVARALMCKPELLFLDEPTSSLDPASTQMIESLISHAHAQGVTIVMVTHDMGQARRMGDEVIFLHAGRIVERGPLSRVLGAPRSDAARAWTQGRLYTATPN